MSYSVNLLKTYHPKVRAAYHRAQRIAPQRIVLHTRGIDAWIRQFGKYFLGAEQMIGNHLFLEVRRYEDYNGESRRYALPSPAPESITEFINRCQAEDLVDVTGTSVVGKTRKQISRMGPEFFLVGSPLGQRLPIQAQFHPFRSLMMKTAVNAFFELLPVNIAEDISRIEEVAEVRALYQNSEKISSAIISNTLDSINVRTTHDHKDSDYYTFDDVVSMFGDSRACCDVEGMKANLVESMTSTIGAEMKIWLKRLPKFWESIYRTNPDLTDTEEKELVVDNISKFFGEIHGKENRLNEFIEHFEGRATRSIGNSVASHERGDDEDWRVTKKKKKRKNPRAKLFVNIDAKETCCHCGSVECESEKMSQEHVGTYLSKKNSSRECLRFLFDRKKKIDPNFSRSMTKLATSIQNMKMNTSGKKKKKKKKDEGISGVIIVKKDRPLDLRKDTFYKKNIKRHFEDNSLVMKSSDKKSKFRMIGNKMKSSGEVGSTYGEYCDETIPGITFFVEI